jgi:hypothetical protein
LEVEILVAVEPCALEAATVAYLEVADAVETGDAAAEASADIVAAAQQPEETDEGLVAVEADQVEDLDLMASVLLDQIHQEIGLPRALQPQHRGSCFHFATIQQQTVQVLLEVQASGIHPYHEHQRRDIDHHNLKR